jgi:hypothetical protein
VGQPSRRGHGDVRHLALRRSRRHGKRVDEARGIYRGEVLAIMGALADILSNTEDILAVLGWYGDDSGESEETDS